MEEVLKEILVKLSNLEGKADTGFATVNERIGMLDRQLNKKIDSLTEVVAKVMEDITDLRTTVEKQQVEIRVIKGGAANA